MVLSGVLVPVSPFRTLDVRRRLQWFASSDKAQHALLQTADIATRLMHGGELHREADVVA